MRFRLTEDSLIESYSGALNVGDIVKLDGNLLNSQIARKLAFSGHLFAITSVQGDYITASPLTSQMKQLNFFYGSVISDWKQIGLKKECFISLTTYGTLNKSVVLGKVTQLTVNDLKNLLQKYSKNIFQNQKIENLIRFV